MPSWEAVCDCCMETVYTLTPELTVRDCPFCGMGTLLGPWPVKPRFQSSGRFDVMFPLTGEEESAERDA